MKNIASFKKIGQTLDDAAGEAFDKVAKILNLGYPGGPEIAKAAEKGDFKKINLPRPMINSRDFNFSFSGLKTAVLYQTKKLPATTYQLQANMAAAFQQAVVDVLVAKTAKAAKKFKAKTVILAGGVAANKLLRKSLEKEVKKIGLRFVVPDFKLCTDNAAMIATAGFFEKPTGYKKIKFDPNLEIST